MDAPAPRVKLSVVLIAYNQPEITARCFAAVERAIDPATMEAVFLDNGSTEKMPAIGRTLRSAEHLLISDARNRAAAAAKGDFLLFIDNDVLLAPDAVERALAAMTDPEVGVVGGRLLHADGRLQHAGMVLRPKLIPWHLFSLEPGEHPAVLASRRVPLVTGAFALYRREVFERIGGFDPIFANDCEDVDAVLRARETGAGVYYEASAWGVHFQGSTRGRKFNELERFRARWQGRVEHDDIGAEVALVRRLLGELRGRAAALEAKARTPDEYAPLARLRAEERLLEEMLDRSCEERRALADVVSADALARAEDVLKAGGG